MKVDVQKLVALTTQSTPAEATHWSTRKMGAALGVSASTVMRHWQANGLKPHVVRRFKVSRDPKFVHKLEDLVGLYMSPPEHALVLCCDEKSQVQALDRTQPGLPMKKGRAQTMTHDYKLHGTTTLFAALNVLDGHVIGQCQQRHTHAEWLKFLRKIDRETPKGKTLHLIADNYATHKHPVVQEWLAKHPRFNMHFTPTSASWLNMVERFFRDLTTERLRWGVFTSVPELVTAIDKCVAHHNTNPKPFIWTKSARDILQKVIRASARLSSKQNGTLHQRSVGSRAQHLGKVLATERMACLPGYTVAVHPVIGNRFLDGRMFCNQNPISLTEIENKSGDLSGRVDRIPMAGRALRHLAAAGVPDGQHRR